MKTTEKQEANISEISNEIENLLKLTKIEELKEKIILYSNEKNKKERSELLNDLLKSSKDYQFNVARYSNGTNTHLYQLPLYEPFEIDSEDVEILPENTLCDVIKLRNPTPISDGIIFYKVVLAGF